MAFKKLVDSLGSLKNRRSEFVLACCLFCLVFAIQWVPILLGILALTLLFERRFNLNLPKGDLIQQVFSLMILLYGWHVLGLIWTENKAVGFQQLEYKLSLLLVPILLWCFDVRLSLSTWCNSIVYGLALTSIMMIAFACYRSIMDTNDNQWGYFEESLFCIFMHRSYTAAYMVLGIAVAYSLWSKSKGWIWWLYILFFSLITLLSGSKAGIITWLILLLLFSWKSLNWTKMMKGRNLILIVVILVVGSVAFFNSNASRRFDYVSRAMSEINWTNNPTTESTGARLLMWNAAIEVWGRQLLCGVGTGDVVDELHASNVEKNNVGVATSRLNAHNQFLNFAVQFGWMGLIMIGLIFFFLFYSSIKQSDNLLLYVTLIFFVNFLFESFLETRSGIVPFSLLICSYLVVKKRSEETLEKDDFESL